MLDEAENERMHLMTFVQIAQPTRLERYVIMFTQAVFYNFYFLLYLLAPRTAHRVVGYFEEEAVASYTQYMEEIDAGRRDRNHCFADTLKQGGWPKGLSHTVSAEGS